MTSANESSNKNAMSNSSTNHSNDSSTSLIPSLLSLEEEEYAISSFQKLLKYETVSVTAPMTGAYVECANYIVQELQSLSTVLTEIHVLPESPAHSPVIVAKWQGRNDALPVILLNSHYDVVPASNEDWMDTTPPFAGVRVDNKIYGRGAQDMKCVCIQYIEAIRKLTTMSYTPLRTIYLTFVPDEEVGGSGMAALLDSKLYHDTLKDNIAMALDEGLASPNNVFSVFYGERLPWWIDITAHGNTGHGSRFIDATAVEQLIALTNKALAFRQEQRTLLYTTEQNSKHENCAHAIVAKKNASMKNQNQRESDNTDTNETRTLGDVTSLNITRLEAGVRVGNTFAYNCVPPVAQCSLDIRISPHVPPMDIANMLDQWCHECSATTTTTTTTIATTNTTPAPPKITWSYTEGQNGKSSNDLQRHATTSTDPIVNPWYGIFVSTMEHDLGLQVSPQVFPAATDSRFLRALGIRALGFSPMRNTEILLHEHNEYIPVPVFLEGISIYVKLIEALSSFEEEGMK